MSNYSENILQAVDMVVTERLKGINFDKTIIGKVIKANKDGSYTISYEAMTLLAYPSGSEEYDEGSQVYVLIPQGDYNLRKIITGRVGAKEIANYLYLNPGKQLVTTENNLYSKENETIQTPIVLRDYSTESPDLPPIKYLYFSADFQTTDAGKTSKTEYGIQIKGKGYFKEPKGEQEYEDFVWDFMSSQFQGNPYMFNGLFKQEYLFDIEQYNKIENLLIEPVEDTLFEMYNIKLTTGYAVESAPSDIKTGKIVLYEKTAKEKYPTPDQKELTLEQLEANEVYKTFELQTKFFLNNQLIDTTLNNSDEYPHYAYKWFVYNKEALDMGNGKHWGQIMTKTNEEYSDPNLNIDTNTKQYVKLDNNKIEQINIPDINEKALQLVVQVYKIDESDGEQKEEKIATSNILPILRSDQADIEGALKGSGVELTAADDGTYFIYDGTTNLVDKELKKNKTFRITAKLTGAAKWIAGQTLRWKIPKNGTMIAAPDPRKYNAVDAEDPDPNKPLLLTNDEKWYIIEDTTAADINPTLDFDISDIYDPAATMNVIRCEVGEGEDQIGSGILLTFGISGSQGTEYTIGISFDKTCITPGGILKAMAHLYNPAGQDITDDVKDKFIWRVSQRGYNIVTGEDGEVSYETVSLSPGTKITNVDNYYIKNNEGEYVRIDEETVVPEENIPQYYSPIISYMGKEVELHASSEFTGADNYFALLNLHLNYQDINILQGKNFEFETFKTIPLWTGTEGTIPEFTGPTTIIYDSQGNNPQYIRSEYTLDGVDGEIDVNSIGDNLDHYGIKLGGETKTLLMPQMITTKPPKITVKLSAAAGEWYQPLAIYRNEYTSAILNSWGGEQIINEGENKILTKMIGAGVKDSNNRFSGVFMGAVGKDITDSDTKTGLYGYQGGQQRFKFTEDGEAYIGTEADNRIGFNKNKSGELEIRTKKFTVQSGTPNTSRYFYMSNDTPNINEELINIGNGAIKVKSNGIVEIGGDNRNWAEQTKYAVSDKLSETPEKDWYNSSALEKEGELYNWDTQHLYLWTKILDKNNTAKYSYEPSPKSTIVSEYSTNQQDWQTTQPETIGNIYYRQVRKLSTENNKTIVDVIQGPILFPKGQDGNGIKSVTVTYGVSSSNTTIPDTWYNTPVSVSDNEFLWTKTITDYTDSSQQDTISYTWSKAGEKGEAGTSVTITSIEYGVNDSNTTPPTDWYTDIAQTNPQPGQSLWTKTTFSDGKISYGIAIQGQDGKDISTTAEVEEIIFYYAQISEFSGSVSYEDIDKNVIFTNTLPFPDDSDFWSYVKTKYSNGKTYLTTPTLVSKNGGKITEYYYKATEIDSNINYNELSYGLKIENITQNGTGNSGQFTEQLNEFIHNYPLNNNEKYYLARFCEEKLISHELIASSILLVKQVEQKEYCHSLVNFPPSNLDSGWTSDFYLVLNEHSQHKDTNPTKAAYIYSRIKTTMDSGDIVYSQISSNTADSFIGAWMKTDDGKVLIDGANLFANSVTTNALATDSIKSLNYDEINSDTGEYIIGSFLDLSTGVFKSQNFKIDEDGNVTIKGVIEATAGGNIGGWKIEDGKLISQNGIISLDGNSTTPIFAGSENGTFSVSNAGVMTCTGAIIKGTLETGSIIGNIDNDIQIYSTNNYTSIASLNRGKSDELAYLRVYNGPQIHMGTNTDPGVSGAYHAYISINGAKITLLTTHGESGLTIGNTDTQSNSYNELTGTWKYKGSMASFTSDINKKNTITAPSENYSILFDNLHPVTYKYNDGTSDRLHTGFIAQEVKQALDIANINTKDFAGLVIFNQDTEEEEWTLRYGEFIALNTWQIQKLKTRVSELETELAEIKEKLK